MNGAFEVSIDIRIFQPGQGNLSIREDFQIDNVGFMELAKILGKFHDLAVKIKAESGMRT